MHEILSLVFCGLNLRPLSHEPSALPQIFFFKKILMLKMRLVLPNFSRFVLVIIENTFAINSNYIPSDVGPLSEQENILASRFQNVRVNV